MRTISKIKYKNLWVTTFYKKGIPQTKTFTVLYSWGVLQKTIQVGTGKELEKYYI